MKRFPKLPQHPNSLWNAFCGRAGGLRGAFYACHAERPAQQRQSAAGAERSARVFWPHLAILGPFLLGREGI